MNHPKPSPTSKGLSTTTSSNTPPKEQDYIGTFESVLAVTVSYPGQPERIYRQKVAILPFIHSQSILTVTLGGREIFRRVGTELVKFPLNTSGKL
jgi:hypothetical protein